jgi:hypothetical protein
VIPVTSVVICVCRPEPVDNQYHVLVNGKGATYDEKREELRIAAGNPAHARSFAKRVRAGNWVPYGLLEWLNASIKSEVDQAAAEV